MQSNESPDLESKEVKSEEERIKVPCTCCGKLIPIDAPGMHIIRDVNDIDKHSHYCIDCLDDIFKTGAKLVRERKEKEKWSERYFYR